MEVRLAIDWLEPNGDLTGVGAAGLVLTIGLAVMALFLAMTYWEHLPWSSEFREHRAYQKRLQREKDRRAQKELEEFCKAEGLPWIDSEVAHPPSERAAERVIVGLSTPMTPKKVDVVREPLRGSCDITCGRTLTGELVTCPRCKPPKPLSAYYPSRLRVTQPDCLDCILINLYDGERHHVIPCSSCRTVKIPEGCRCFYDRCPLHP